MQMELQEAKEIEKSKTQATVDEAVPPQRSC